MANIVRRNANYKPTIWNSDYIESLSSKYTGEWYKKRIDKLKEEVKLMFEKVEDPLAQLELIDALQRLGISYHFEDQINTILKPIININNPSANQTWKANNLYAVSLEFRLLRQNRYSLTSECFNAFKDENGHFNACLSEDIKGLLSLYEASFYSFKDENILDQARDFTAKRLEEYMKKNNTDQNHDNHDDLPLLVGHALELPLHWRMLRLEARWFIEEVYGKRQNMSPILLELATLDFNVVQSIYIEDLKTASRWWNSTRVGQKCGFARDRLVENFLWTVGVIFEPQFNYCRRMLTRLGGLITVIDDIFDVYGTLDELKLFEDALVRWDLNAINQLPYYIQVCFFASYNSVNEVAFDVLKDQGLLITQCLKKMWADQAKCYMVEANWYKSEHIPTLQEYMDNGWISIGIAILLVHVYFFVTNPISEESIQCLMNYPSVIRQASIICRLTDDLGTASVELKRGDVPKSIQCYMHESGVSEEEARRHIKFLISETWKQMNEDRVAKCPFSRVFIETSINVSRMAHSMYQYGDGHGAHQDIITKEKVLSVIVNPIPYYGNNEAKDY